MNLYARIADIKTDLGITTTTNDALYIRLLDTWSDAINRELGRHFYARVATLYPECHSPWDRLDRLRLQPGMFDLISVSALAVDEDGDGTFELTLVENTDYYLERDEHDLPDAPYRYIRLNPNGTQLWAWPTGERRIRVAGTWGYSNETETTGTTANEAIDDSETGIDVVSGAAISVGETIVIDSEQMYVSAIATNTLTVVRGINGTTAASHSNGTTVYRRRYPRVIEEALRLQATRIRWELQGGYGGAIAASEAGSMGANAAKFSSLYPAIRDLSASFQLAGFH